MGEARVLGPVSSVWTLRPLRKWETAKFVVCAYCRLPCSNRKDELLVLMPAGVNLQRVRLRERSHNAECLHLSKFQTALMNL